MKQDLKTLLRTLGVITFWFLIGLLAAVFLYQPKNLVRHKPQQTLEAGTFTPILTEEDGVVKS